MGSIKWISMDKPGSNIFSWLVLGKRPVYPFYKQLLTLALYKMSKPGSNIFLWLVLGKRLVYPFYRKVAVLTLLTLSSRIVAGSGWIWQILSVIY